MGSIVLKAEVLYAGKGCPVCGQDKTSRARTCRDCYGIFGREITYRVDAVTEAAIAARQGHEASQNTEKPIARDVIWGPILAQVRIDRDAKLCQPGNGIQPYWECQKNFKGGFVSLFVFGAEQACQGSKVTVLVELKAKNTAKGQVSYLRAQAVESGIRSNIKLAIGQYDDANYSHGLPTARIAEQGRRFSVGFVGV